MDGKFDLAVSFEVIEHLPFPDQFISRAKELLKPGGKLLITTLSGEGYDIKMLGKDHDNVSPPHHINFINPASAVTLFRGCGFRKIQIETPGKLDIDILINRVESFPYLLDDPLFKKIYYGDKELQYAFQNFLAKNFLSSLMWIWAE